MQKKIPTFQQLQTQDSRSIIENRHFGNTIVVRWRQDGEPKYVLGPHFVVFICTLIITVLLFASMGISIISDAKQENKLLITIIIVFALSFYAYSYIKIGLSNPGIASSSQELSQDLKSNLRYCVPCKIIRPLGTVHCYSCDLCIHGYDHHCPWIGKCVGKENMGSFKCFIFSIVLALSLIAYCLYLGNKGVQITKQG